MVCTGGTSAFFILPQTARIGYSAAVPVGQVANLSAPEQVSNLSTAWKVATCLRDGKAKKMIDVRAILDLHETTVARWHEREIDNPYEGFLHLVCLQHQQNFRLWHQEDIARSPE